MLVSVVRVRAQVHETPSRTQQTEALVTDKSDKDKCERFAELLGLDSKNFLGTGLTLNEFMQLHRAEQLAASCGGRGGIPIVIEREI